MSSLSRKPVGPVRLVRLAGVLGILAAIFLGPAPPTDTAVGGTPDVRGHYQLAPASVSRARMLESVGGEPEARGCAASISNPETVRDRVVLTLLCGARGDLTIAVRHVRLGSHVPRGADDCFATSAIRGVVCQVSGSITEPLRNQLIAAVTRIFARVFPEDPFVIEPDWDVPAFAVAAGIAVLTIFLWLVVSGAFTFGSWEKGDWIALVPVVGALAVRELLTLHSVQEIEIQFALAPVGRHSVVYPLFQLFYSRLVLDSQAVTFHVNGVLGALAILPLYLFVRQRTGDRVAGFVVGCFFAVHPLVARFCPTDAPYSFIFVTWFSGLALLSAPAADGLATFGGAALLGIAASARMDGMLYLAVSALMLDPKVLLIRIRRAPVAAVSGAGAIVLLIGVQMYFLLAFHGQGMHPDSPPWGRLHEIWQQPILQPTVGDGLWAFLVGAGALAGIVRRWRLGPGAFAGLIILLLTTPFAVSPFWITLPSGESPNAWHRFVPGAALQCIVAGIGAVALARPLTGLRRRRDWAAALPGIAAALYVLFAHRALLSASYVFNEEYAMVRDHLVHRGTVEPDCDLFVMTRVEKDVEIRDFRRVVPGTTTIDCSVGDCARSLTPDRRQYYMRSAACFFHPDGLPPHCAEVRSDEDIRRECLMPECRAFESAAALTPIEERSIDTRITFPREAWNYPARIPVALFLATARATKGPDNGTCNIDGGTLVLPPSASVPIEQAFSRMQPSIRYDEIRIDCDHVVARLCASPGPPSTCFTIRLDPQSVGCTRASGPFCVTFLDGAQSAAVEATIATALATVDRASLWSNTVPGEIADPASISWADQGRWERTLATALALVALPIGLGALLGVALRRLRRRRFAGVVAAIALVAVPVVLVTELVLWFPVIGLWDALLEGCLVGAGVAWTAHRALADHTVIALSAGSLAASLLLFELACRLWLPPPPTFPTKGGPHLLLADAMRAGTQSHSWEVRSKEIVCSILYQEQYPGILDVSEELEIVQPRHFIPRVDAHRRILHIGDSMTFGFGVSRDETFTADLERLEPGTQHINGGIPGTAPDAYLLVLRRWLDLHDVDLVVMHVFEGNDLPGLDDSYPCCDWQSLLTYGPGGAVMRCPTATTVNLGRAGVTWLRYNSPPPYLVRSLIGRSAAAAYVGAAISSGMLQMPMHANQPEAIELQHLESILRTARDELRARHIPFVVDVLPSRTRIENPMTTQPLAPKIMAVAQQLNVPALDAAGAVQDGVRSGQRMFFDNPTDPHFTAAANEVVARWLHDRLPASADLSPTP